MGKKGKKKKKGGVAEAGVRLTMQEDLTYMSLQAETLERELQVKAAHAEEAARSEMEVRAKVDQMEEDFRDEQNTTFAVTADMARQYKALQEELIYKINALETQLTEQREELDITNHELQELIRDKDEDIEDRERQIENLNKRMNEMSEEFVNMLTETLDLMKTQIGEKLQDNQDSEAGQAEFAKRLVDYSNKAYQTVSVNSRALADKGDKSESSGLQGLPAPG